MTATVETERPSLRSLAALVRLPNLFTAPPDVVLGAALAAGTGQAVSPAPVAGLAVASMALYAAGTTLNDYFDAAEDARERPDRPIPSGEVSRGGALGVGVALLVTGVAVAAVAAGPTAGAVAAVLAAAVVIYDGSLAGTGFGFVVMGTARGLNVLLGTTVAGAAPDALPAHALAVPAVVALYVASVTAMAEGETGEGSRAPVLAAVAGVGLVTLAVAGVLAVRAPSLGGTALSVACLGGYLAWVGRPLRAAVLEPTPDRVGPAVGACVLGIVPLDAAFAAAVGVRWALAAAAFLVPAVALSRAFEVT